VWAICWPICWGARRDPSDSGLFALRDFADCAGFGHGGHGDGGIADVAAVDANKFVRRPAVTRGGSHRGRRGGIPPRQRQRSLDGESLFPHVGERDVLGFESRVDRGGFDWRELRVNSLGIRGGVGARGPWSSVLSRPE
jgi:hypothetical protein